MPLALPDLLTERFTLRAFAVRLALLFGAYIVLDLLLVWTMHYALPSDVVTVAVLMIAAALAGDAYVRRAHRPPTAARAWRLAALFALIQLLFTTLFTLGLTVMGVPMLIVYLVIDLFGAAPWLLLAIATGYLLAWVLAARLGLWIGTSAADKRLASTTRASGDERQ